MSKIAFLGLGQMGTPIAARLLHAGHAVTVWNRTPGRTAPLVEQGAVAASTPAGAAAGVDVAITMVATPQALEGVLFGPNGLATGLRSGPSSPLSGRTWKGTATPRPSNSASRPRTCG